MVYAVKTGRVPGIYLTWDECKKQVEGFSGAEYKKFKDEEMARDYLNPSARGIGEVEGYYIDGSYSHTDKRFGYAVVVLGKDMKYVEYGDVPEEFRESRNIGSELWSSIRAIELMSQIGDRAPHNLFYDYEGVMKFVSEWRTRTGMTKAYKEFIRRLINKGTKIRWVKVQSHSNDTLNDAADSYAKMALRVSGVERIQYGIDLPYKSDFDLKCVGGIVTA